MLARTLLLAATLVAASPTFAQEQSEGQITWASNLSVVPAWFDPAEHFASQPAMSVYYAIHDALVKPMPDGLFTPSLAETWSRSDDGLIYEFVLRDGIKFHNGDPVTSADVKFSFERYDGAASNLLKSKVSTVETPDERHVIFKLHEPWPDFMTYLATDNSGAAWVLPQKYIEEVGVDGFKQQPIGAGPYRFVSLQPGVEFVVEAFEDYWRKTPNVERLVFKTVTDAFTRAAMVRTGEADIAIVVPALLLPELESAGVSIESTRVLFSQWLNFTNQWDEQSPWSKQKVREAVNYAINRDEINKAVYAGGSTPAGSIIPPAVPYAIELPPYPYDPEKAKQLLSEAGYPEGFEGGPLYVDSTYTDVMEAVLNDLQAVGIRLELRPLERAAYYAGFQDKSLKGVLFGMLSSMENAGMWLAHYVSPEGNASFGTYPDIAELIEAQAAENNEAKRIELLSDLQHLVRDRAMFAPIMFPKLFHAVGPRIAESGLGLIAGYAYSAPYEDLELK